MSTRSMIAVENNKKYTAIYCHSDGYLSYVGLMLFCFYGSERMAKDLMGLGALSSIGPVLGRPVDMKKGYTDSKYYETRIKGQCVAYSRDAQQQFEVVQTSNMKDLLTESYFYVFRNGEWYYRGGEAQRLSKVSLALKKDKEIDAGLQKYIYEMCDNDHKRIFIQRLKELGICKIKETKLYDYTILGILPNGEYKIKCNINNSYTEIDKEGILGLKEEKCTIDTTNANTRL